MSDLELSYWMTIASDINGFVLFVLMSSFVLMAGCGFSTAILFEQAKDKRICILTGLATLFFLGMVFLSAAVLTLIPNTDQLKEIFIKANLPENSEETK